MGRSYTLSGKRFEIQHQHARRFHYQAHGRDSRSGLCARAPLKIRRERVTVVPAIDRGGAGVAISGGS
jgi:hypothetical protein